MTYVKCWQCNEELDVTYVEENVYNKLIDELRLMLCDNSVADMCDLWWKHEDCLIIMNLIEMYKEKINDEG